MFFILLILLTIVSPFQNRASADDFVRAHELDCPKEFPCFPELKPRVEFWIEIFSRYRSDQAVFHDSETPQRVYTVVDGLDCNAGTRRDQKKVERERSRLQGILRDLARDVDAGKKEWTAEQASLAARFADATGDTFREAAETIRCQQGNRDRFAEGLAKFGAYREFIRSELSDAKLPEDIQYLPFVESAFNPEAYSRVGAAGLWQIMPRTARLLGLKIQTHLDERRDPYTSTKAAVRYLKSAYEQFDTTLKEQDVGNRRAMLGPFVITSYNYGTAGMGRALRQFGGDFVRMLHEFEGRRFRTAVRNFYVSFLAARHVALNAGTYFPDVKPDSPEEFQTLEVERPTSVERIGTHFGVKPNNLRRLNPALTQWVWKAGFLVPAGYEIRLPVAVPIKAKTAALWNLPPEKDPWEESGEHRVQRGETPCQIARIYRANCSQLMALNGIGRRGFIRVGQRLKIPPRITTVAKAVPSPTPETQGPPTLLSAEYAVQQDGEQSFVLAEYEESTSHYADWLGLISAADIEKINGLPEGGALAPGQTIVLPVKDDARKKDFEQKRADYHRALEAEFFVAFEFDTEEPYVVQRGDSASSIAEAFEIPEWLLARQNPAAFRSGLKEGNLLSVPRLHRREPATE